MANQTKSQFWSNPWVLAIGTTILTYVVPKLIDVFAGTTILIHIWDFVKTIFTSVLKFSNQTFSVSLWIIILLSVPIALFIIAVLWAYISSREGNSNSSNVTGSSFTNYSQDNFDGIVYKWRYTELYGKYTITDFLPYCPIDNCRLLGGVCPICNTPYYYKMKQDSELEILVQHRIDNNLFPKSNKKVQD